MKFSDIFYLEEVVFSLNKCLFKYVVKYNVFIVFLFITVRFFTLLIIFFIMTLISAIFNFFWRVVFVSWYRDRWLGI